MRKRRSGPGWLLLAMALVVAAGIGIYLARRGPPPSPYVPESAPAAATDAQPAAPEAPAHPIGELTAPPSEPPQQPLPALADSDAPALATLGELFGLEDPATLFVAEHLVPRIVVTVDNLPRQRIVSRILPVRQVPGALQVAREGDTVMLDEANAARYEPYVAMLESADPDALAAAYVRAYPLFQQAYVELGYPDGYFNDRLVEVIDHLLAAPRPARAPVLEPAPRGWRFADPALESASVGHKLFLRMSPQQAARVQQVLRELRARIVAQPLPATEG